MRQYRVEDRNGSHFQSFKNYTEASELRDELSKRYPHMTFKIVEEEWYE